MSVAAIVGSAFSAGAPSSLVLVEERVETRFGPATVHRCTNLERDAFVLFRHGLPHTWLPNQINYRAHAAALSSLGCTDVLVTSSVGVLNPALPMNAQLLVKDIIHLDNRLPSGEACTMFDAPAPGQGHLVIKDGLLSSTLSTQVREMAARVGYPIAHDVTFAYVQGPRTKTPAENRAWTQLGADVNSMTLAPEVILANELEINCAALVVGHKPSTGDSNRLGARAIADSLDRARDATVEIVVEFLQRSQPVPFSNTNLRF